MIPCINGPLRAAILPLSLVLTVGLASCKQESAPPAAPPSAAPAPGPAAERTAEQAAPVAAPEAAPAAAPAAPPKAPAKLTASPAKAFKPTKQADLGTRPEGVGLAKGDKVPAFQATTVEGRPFSNADLLAGGPVLVIFYRGGWCPYCSAHVRQMTDAIAQFTELGVTPVMVSVDRVEGAVVTRRAYDVPFPLVSDPALSMHKAFGVAFALDDAMVAKLQGYGMDIEAWSGVDHHNLAVPSCFLVTADNTVAFSHADTDYTTRPTAAQLAQVVKAWRASTR